MQANAEIAALERQTAIAGGLSASSTGADAASFLATNLLQRSGL
jgi:hypothetical protein